MSADELKAVLSRINIENAPATSIALEEMRRQYDDEETRREAVETKTSALLALDAVLIPIVISISSSQSFPVRIGLIVLLLGSAALCILTLQRERYRRPLNSPENILPYAQSEPATFESEFLKNYIISIYHNRQVNDRRYQKFKWALLVTAIGIMATGIAAIAPT